MTPITPLPMPHPRGAQPPAPHPHWPVLRLGFRPFYLGAALWACGAVPLWVAAYLGHVDLPQSVSPLLWHAHEMLFGFAAAVIVGFLLTAVKAWTGLPTVHGAWLGALALVWLAARVAAFVAPYALYAALDIVLLPAVAAVLLRVLIKAGNKRNMPLVVLLLLLSSANVAFHLAVLDVLELAPLKALHAGLGIIVLVECVMAGRVVPAFTQNATPGLVLHIPRVFEVVLLAVTALALALWVLVPPGMLTLVVCALAAVLHGMRLWLWQPWVTFKRPILWILPAAYAWVALGFGLLALAQWGVVANSLAVHAFAVGATGGLIIGMVTRTARGHTGRPLQVSRTEVWAYALVLLAAVMRVAVPAIAPVLYVPALLAAAVLWALAFALYLGLYTPWLLGPRLDGKDG